MPRWRRLAVAFLIAAAAGCAKSSGQASGAPTIKVAYWGGPEEMAIIEGLIKDWKATHPDVSVRLEHTPFSAYVSRMLTRMAGNVAPDIMAVEVNLFPSLWAKGAFRSLQPFLDHDPGFTLKTFFPEVVHRFTVNGELFAVPRDTAPFACVYYNKTLFDQARLSYPRDDWTWDDLLRVAKALTKTEDGRITRYGFYAWAWQNFVYANGGRLVDNVLAPTRCLLGRREAVEGLQFYADLMNVSRVAPTPVALGNLVMGAQQLFMSQRVAMFSSGFWEVPILRQIKDFEWDVVMFPKGPSGIQAFATGGTGYAMLRTTQHPDLAWDVLKALTGEAGQRRLATAGLIQPANRQVAESDAFALSPLPPAHKAMLNAAVAHAIYEPFLPSWREITEVHIVPQLDPVFNGQQTAKAATAAIVPVVDAALAEAAANANTRGDRSHRHE